jgi:hypothetical protein
MAQESILKSFANRYERKARLYPAFLALLPILGVAVGVYGLQLDVRRATVALISAVGGFYLLAHIARELGKRREQNLYMEWGGKPTTQIQRHRDSRVDRVAKATYHSFLSSKLNVPYPTAAEEQLSPELADDTYSAGIMWLLERTRDTSKFALLFEENIGYGYRRNALGLKPIAITVSITAIFWVCIAEHVLGLAGINLQALTTLRAGALGSIAVSVTLLFVWIFFFTKQTVKTSAFAYADALLRACWMLKG